MSSRPPLTPLIALVLTAAAFVLLGSPGDPWDTPWDMACALIGGSLALVMLRRLQDRQMASRGPAVS